MSSFRGQRIGLTLNEQNIAAIDRARADIRARSRKAVERNEIIDRILSRVDFEQIVDEFTNDGRVVV